MSQLKLRAEFLAKHMRATAIELCNKQNTGWAQGKTANDLLEITFPTLDIQRALDAMSSGKPVVFLGQRGRGKSHIMALLHHAIASPAEVEGWISGWAKRPGMQGRHDVALPKGFLPITETMSNHEYPTLWDVIFDRHPKGQYYRGKFEQAGTPVPAKSLLQDMFSEQKTALILDELQTWYDGTHDEQGDQGRKRRTWAFNFIQNLSELADQRPDLLCLVVSVRDNTTDAFQQIHRVKPIVVDFKGETAREDRKRLVLHRLFENRTNFADAEIDHITRVYSSERNRLLYSDRTDADKATLAKEVVSSWPFSPELMMLLEDQILMAAAAQDTRDAIRVLAEVYRVRGEKSPVITPADFCIDDDDCGVVSLIDSFATSADQERLREKAQQNLVALRSAKVEAPHDREVISSLWMRSLSVTQDPGGTRNEVQLDVTRAARNDDNAFTVELATIVDNSFNIHEIGTHEKRFCFKLPENPVSKLKAWAKNDRYFDPDTPTPHGLLPFRRDQVYIRDVLDHILRSPDSISEQPCHPIILDTNWQQAPWANVKQADQPTKWAERQTPVLVVLPTSPGETSEEVSKTLGPWLVNHVAVNRNALRFLLPVVGDKSIYDDREILIPARCALLAREWKEADPAYGPLHRRFEGELRLKLNDHFDRFALLSLWNYQSPADCVFHVENHGSSASKIPAEIEKHVRENLFAAEDFEELALEVAKRGETVRQLLALQRGEPLPGKTAIPFLGETPTYEQLLRMVADDKLALLSAGTALYRLPDESEDDALRRLRTRGWKNGRDLYDIQLRDRDEFAAGGVNVSPPIAPSTSASGGSGGMLFPTQPIGLQTPTAPPLSGQPSTSIGPAPVTSTQQAPIAPDAAALAPVIRKSLGAKTGINLLGDLEKWALPDAQRVTQATLTFHGLSIKELRELCTKLPPKLAAELQLMLPPEGGPS